MRAAGKQTGASLYVPVLEAHRMEPARKMTLKTAARIAGQAAAKPKPGKAVFTQECAQPLPGGGARMPHSPHHALGATAEASSNEAPTCDCDAAYRMGQSESRLLPAACCRRFLCQRSRACDLSCELLAKRVCDVGGSRARRRRARRPCGLTSGWLGGRQAPRGRCSRSTASWRTFAARRTGLRMTWCCGCAMLLATASGSLLNATTCSKVGAVAHAGAAAQRSRGDRWRMPGRENARAPPGAS
jgi:hypothetical protein